MGLNRGYAKNVNLPDDVAYFIATNVKSNVRELEGSLVRLGAYSRLTGRGITLPLAQEVLKNLTENNTRVVSIEGIQKVVADHYSLKVAELKAKNNSRRVAEPRQMAMFLCRELTDSSLPEIGKEFGGKHHTTVLHSIRKIKNLRESDPRRNNLINKLISSVR
jgi:chromosomal replication initiator protein